MPTGYTDCIKDGISFKKYAMKCARAFGACIEMRDESWDAEIPDKFPISNYHLQKILEAKEKLKKLKKMKISEAENKAKKEFDEKMKYNLEAIKKNQELQEKYEKMLEAVRAWNPPSSDHVEYKKFMETQITESIKFDCGGDYYIRNKPKPLSGKQWLEDQIEAAIHDINYHTKEHSNEVKRNTERNLWVKQLRDSLKNE